MKMGSSQAARTARSLCVGFVAVLTSSSCTSNEAMLPPGTLDEAVRWEREIQLEENDDVINVRPQLSITADHAIWVADAQEQQIRGYDSSGTLTAVLGKQGEGPGEFVRLIRAIPALDGSVIGVEQSGRFSRFDDDGEVLATGRLPFVNIVNVTALGDSALLVAGQLPDDEDQHRLHIWNLQKEERSLSFFAPPARMVGAPVSADVGPGGIVAAFGLSDSLYVFSREGELAERIPLPSSHLRSYADPASMPPPADWPFSFSIVLDVFWLADRSVLVQYGEVRREGGFDLRLLHMDLSGTRRFELLDTPRLKAVSPDQEQLFFDAHDLTVNEIRVARVRD